MTQNTDVVGIDVSKKKLDVYALSSRAERQLANDASGHRLLIDWMRSLGVETAVMEASGGYERAVAKALRRAGLSVVVLDPKRVRDYAKAVGRYAKTDRIDAQMIAELGAILVAAEPWRISEDDPAREKLAALVGARHALLDHHLALTQQAEATEGPARRAFAKVATALERQTAQMDRLIAETIAAHPAMAALARRLATVPCIGPATIAAIIAWLPELGRVDRQAIAALVGVAPFDDSSADRVGQKHIHGGRKELRNVIYMAAMVGATRHNPVLRAFYTRLRQAGKQPKVAIVACMRKLLTILNTMVARQEDWNPSRATS